MTISGEERGGVNYSEATREVKCRELAVMDWGKVPAAEIRKTLGGVSFQTITAWRDSEEYKETIDELRAEWMDQVRKLPNTGELRSKISMGMTLSLDRLIEILTPGGKTAHKDRIGAARLMAQLDGRFLKGSDEDGDAVSRTAQSVADELLTALAQKPRVN